ncbi:hypothetical protein RV11_GL001914 [Enterococcus phoeniculicola]|jgi:arylsulfatase A-like enzyme|uniref:Sulfatase N-terminal domain-containing protein n=1 Tax=Enterococcus phoeniculicola ATCC BAA-412 TaxID=1158610 RepID=R3WKF1_9ENTE|nr:sulfatase-like hydrolase/transferase [Enterococcus phoeniculicola]EOL42365.1 hypothetical protein UC3_02717 [Enterococcus phoeniculicola ATCC BAA-412]EOT79356.1 hypothetical protein I589_00864 [Enterococcus phoeniculicola ATCC BAA-412]OJG73104.1 hypothetical protein RV11_GL001914 [Enterococcus phoeniculicola]
MKKNVLLLIADDQRFDTIHALGNKEIQTPNLDKLVARGVSFTNAFIPGGTSGAVCMPSRAMINTSQFLTSWENCGETIPETQALLGETLKNEGYETWGIGKWHNGTESYARSFSNGEDIFFGGMWDHWNVPVNHFDPTGRYDQLKTFTQDPFSSNKTMQLPAEHIAIGKHSTDLFADRIIEAIQSHTSEQPFFIYGGFLAPHDPRTMPDAFKEMYNPEELSLPENFLPEHPFPFDIRGERDETLEAYPREPQKICQHLADYYAMISHIDARIGDILDSLEEQGILDETLIIFTGDNGLSIGQHGLMGKQNLYDCSIRVPLILSGPALPKNRLCDERCLLVDIMPTILDYLSIPIPKTIYGESLLPVISGEKKGRDQLFLMFTTKIRGLVTESFKYLEYRTKDGHYSQLFDRKKDPFEKVNLCHESGYESTVDSLKDQLYMLAKEHGDLEFIQGKVFWNHKEKQND